MGRAKNLEIFPLVKKELLIREDKIKLYIKDRVTILNLNGDRKMK